MQNIQDSNHFEYKRCCRGNNQVCMSNSYHFHLEFDIEDWLLIAEWIEPSLGYIIWFLPKECSPHYIKHKHRQNRFFCSSQEANSKHQFISDYILEDNLNKDHQEIQQHSQKEVEHSSLIRLKSILERMYHMYYYLSQLYNLRVMANMSHQQLLEIREHISDTHQQHQLRRSWLVELNNPYFGRCKIQNYIKYNFLAYLLRHNLLVITSNHLQQCRFGILDCILYNFQIHRLLYSQLEAERIGRLNSNKILNCIEYSCLLGQPWHNQQEEFYTRLMFM